MIDWELFSREVVRRVGIARGYRDKIPGEVLSDIHAMLTRRHQQFNSLALSGASPRLTAKVIQDSEWDRPTTEG